MHDHRFVLFGPEIDGQVVIAVAEDARKKGQSPDQFAQAQADTWKKGLAEWDQDGERIRRLKDSAEYTIYTPGSTAGIPVSIIKSFAAPARAVIDDNELLQERVSTTATSSRQAWC